MNLKRRIRNLDPSGSFYNLYKHSINAYLNESDYEISDVPFQKRSLTITYAVGGAGAQKEVGKQIAQSLADEIIKGKIKLNLVAGTRKELRDYFNGVKKQYYL